MMIVGALLRGIRRKESLIGRHLTYFVRGPNNSIALFAENADKESSSMKEPSLKTER